MQRKPLFARQQSEQDDHLAGAPIPDLPLPASSPAAEPASAALAAAIEPAREETPAAPAAAPRSAPTRLSSPPRSNQGPTLVQRIKDKLPLIEYAQRHLKLKSSPQSQGEFFGSCPSSEHKDKSPSFYISSSKNLYHCHGCGISGNVIQLYAILNHMEEDDAKFQLGRELGVFNERRLDDAESLMSKAAHRFAGQLLRKDDALAYLTQQRGITTESIERFNIGFCWGREFLDFDLPQQKMALQAGLAREETGKAYMAGRITFPVRDRTGKVVGFAGRLVPSDRKVEAPKYINSPETAWFKKSELLYGAYEAGAGISRSGFAVVVEGYMDVVALHQSGIDNAVAVMGASANETTFRSLWDMTSRVVFCLDGDVAGAKGTLRSVLAAAPTMKDGSEIAIASLPTGMDPDEYVLQNGREAFDALCNEAVPLSRFLMNQEAAKHRLTDPEGRSAYLRAAADMAELFKEAPLLGEQIVAEARAVSAAHLVAAAMDHAGIGTDIEPQALRDAMALLQRRLAAVPAANEPQAPTLARSMRPR